MCTHMQVHAEQFLMANLVLHNESSLHTLAISAAPCGHCRQFYSELACAVSERLCCLLARQKGVDCTLYTGVIFI